MTRKNMHVALVSLIVAATFLDANSNLAATIQHHDHENNHANSCCKPELYNDRCCDVNTELLIKGEFLYWQGKLCGLEGAFGNTSVNISNTTPTLEITTLTELDQKPNFRWEPGFKVGAELWINCLNLELNWIDFHGRAHYQKGSQHGNWKLKYDTLDFTIGYDFYPCSRFLVKPMIGARAAWIHQTLRSHLETLTARPTDSGIQNTLVMSDLDDHEDFRGVGPQVGVEADWYLGKDFSLYAMVDLITYYGYTHCDYDNVDSFTATLNISNWNKQKSFCCIGTDGEIGIRWDKYLLHACSMHLMLKLGAEQHHIFDFSDLGSDGSLNLAGGVFEAGLGYPF
jgi:hypothetical protein